MVAGDPAVSERHALPARPSDTTKIIRPFSLGCHLEFNAHGQPPDRGLAQLRLLELTARGAPKRSDGGLCDPWCLKPGRSFPAKHQYSYLSCYISNMKTIYCSVI